MAARIDAVASEQGLLTYSTSPTTDGYAGDQSLFAPLFVSTDEELELMVDRFAASVRSVYQAVSPNLGKVGGRPLEPEG